MKFSERLQIARALLAAADAIEGRAGGDTSAPQAFDIFKSAADEIWGPETMKQVSLRYSVEELPGVLAGLRHLRHNKRKMAIGQSLIYLPRDKSFTLVLDPKLLEHDREFVRRIMVHEAIHIGYPKHDADFRHLVKKYRGALTETDANEASDKPYQAQKKVGSRFQTVERFETELEAWTFIKQEFEKDRSVKWRLYY